MNPKELLIQRLSNQKISASAFKHPAQVVEYMGAMQAQEYAMAKWAIGLHLPGTKDADVEKAFNKGEILRTHVLRPTWHFVSPKDIRWMLDLTGARIHQANNFMCRKLGLDEALLKKSAKIIGKALEDGQHKTRYTLAEELLKHNLKIEGQHLTHIMMYAELEKIICSGAREGKQFTYALLDERVPAQKKLSREEALTKLSLCYFKSRGPATIRDFSTWSNLTLKDVKEGIALLDKKIKKESYKNTDYYFIETATNSSNTLSSFLMPDYDEYAMSYKDRSEIFDTEAYKKSISRGNPVFNRMIILDGRIEGTWQKNIQKGKIAVELFPFKKLSPLKQKALKEALFEFEKFTREIKD